MRSGVNWLANALSRVNLVAAKPPESQGDEPTAIDIKKDAGLTRQVELVAQIAGGVAGQGQLMAGAARQLTVPGVGYIHAPSTAKDEYGTWSVLSNEEARKSQGGDGIEVANAETGEWQLVADADLLIKVWRSHPRRRHLPDSAIHALLPVLNEIKFLTQRIAADARSRLAGNGLLLMPEEAEFPPGQGQPTEMPDGADEFTETFIAVTQIPIGDQSSPAATTPLVARMPGEFIKDVQHIKFYSEFDVNLDPLRQSAIKRLAFGLDAPAEALLGFSDMNHWNGWLVSEQAITMQIEPLAETICHALTMFYLRPALEGEGLDPDSAIVWYDTSDLSSRPDHSEAAKWAHGELLISDAAVLRYVGLEPDDAPTPEEYKKRVLLQVAAGAPTMAPAMLAAAGILDAEIADAADGAPKTEADATADPAASNGDSRTPPDRPEGEPETQASAALLAAADGIVVRALEVSGNRLRSAAGRGRGGAAAVACQDPVTLHAMMPATEFASLDHLLAGAWDRVPAVAARYGIDPESMEAALNGYTRALIASGSEHHFDLLALALGVRVPALC